MRLIDVKKLKDFLASKVVMMTDYDDGIAASNIDEYIDEFVASQQPEPCEDAVNRETLLKFFDGWMSALDENCHNQSVSDLKIIKRDFANLPSVTPKQRTGHWILDRSGAYCCSECMEPCAGYVMMKPRDKFCKMCGSRNEVTT